MKLVQLLMFLVLCLNAEAQVFNSKFDSQRHPKAKGAWVTVRYPTGWQAKEGERPNIVQKFTGDYNGMFVVLSLQILNAGGPVEKECSDMTVKEFSEAFSDKQNGQFVTSAKKIRHEDKPAFLYEMQSKVDRVNISLVTSHKIMTVCHKNLLISAWCSPSKVDVSSQLLASNQQHINSASPVCFQYFNSLVLMDKY